jgi:lipopolysaccharide export system permease protein
MTRHILVELTKVFVFALVILTGLIVVVFLVRELLREGLPVLQIARLLPYILPEALRITVPVTLLLAATTIYSRMAGYNEVVALKSLGVSPLVILWPTFAAAFLVSLVTVWLNDVAVSWGAREARRVVFDAAEEIAYGRLRTERRYASPQFTINVKRVEERTLVRPTVTINSRGSTPTITIEAESAELLVDPKENLPQLRLKQGSIEVEGRGRIFFSEYSYELPLTDPNASERSQRPAELPLWQIPEETARQREAIERQREELAAVAAQQLLTGELDRLGGPEWNRRAALGENLRTRLCQLHLEPYRRWSAGFSCLCFVWVGAPMGIRRRNRDFLTSFFLCFAPILIVYYPLLAYGISGAKNGTIPPISVWAGNALLVVWGTWLLRKVMRY